MYRQNPLKYISLLFLFYIFSWGKVFDMLLDIVFIQFLYYSILFIPLYVSLIIILCNSYKSKFAHGMPGLRNCFTDRASIQTPDPLRIYKAMD